MYHCRFFWNRWWTVEIFTTLGELPNVFLWCYLVFTNGNNVPHPVTYFVSEIRWRLRIGDAETSSNFWHRVSLQWRHNELDCVSYHQPHDCLLSRLFRHRSKKTSKPRVTGLCAGNSPGTGEFPAQMASNAEYVSIWWRHHVLEISPNGYPWIYNLTKNSVCARQEQRNIPEIIISYHSNLYLFGYI